MRGERIVVKSRDVDLTRPVRLLHPRFPLYVVPWGEGLYMIGATVIESEETGPITRPLGARAAVGRLRARPRLRRGRDRAAGRRRAARLPRQSA